MSFYSLIVLVLLGACKRNSQSSELESSQVVAADASMDALTAFNAITKTNWDTACVHGPLPNITTGEKKPAFVQKKYSSEITFKTRYLRDIKSLVMESSSDVKMGIAGGVKGVVELSAEAQFLNEIAEKMDSKSIYIALSVNVRTGAIQNITEGPTSEAIINSAEASPDTTFFSTPLSSGKIQKTLVVKNLNAFRHVCGDYYLSEFIEGGVLVGLLKISLTSEEGRNTLKKALDANGHVSPGYLAKIIKNAGVDLKTSTTTEKSELGRDSGLSIETEFYQKLGPDTPGIDRSHDIDDAMLANGPILPNLPNFCRSADGKFVDKLPDEVEHTICQAMKTALLFPLMVQRSPAKIMANFEPYLSNPIFKFENAETYERALERGVDFSDKLYHLELQVNEIASGLQERVRDPSNYFLPNESEVKIAEMHRAEMKLNSEYSVPLIDARRRCSDNLDTCNFENLPFKRETNISELFPLPPKRDTFGIRKHRRLVFEMFSESSRADRSLRSAIDRKENLDRPFWLSWAAWGAKPKCYTRVQLVTASGDVFAPPESPLDSNCTLNIHHEVSLDLLNAHYKSKSLDSGLEGLNVQVELWEQDPKKDDLLASTDSYSLTVFLPSSREYGGGKILPMNKLLAGKETGFRGVISVHYVDEGQTKFAKNKSIIRQLGSTQTNSQIKT
jgi:hypothetical protein